MGSKREKYPEKCPWDLGPNQHLAKAENWTLRLGEACLLYTSPSPRDSCASRMPSSA